MKNTLQRPTSLTVSQLASPSPGNAIKPDQMKTPSPSKIHNSSTIIQIPPSPSQNKVLTTSPTVLDTSQSSANVPTANSVSFLEMASSFFRWGNKSSSSATVPPSQSEASVPKVEASPKSATGDTEGNNPEMQTKSNRTSLDRVAQPPVINVITNPNENIKVNVVPGVSNVPPVTGKQRTSRKTMRAPQPPIAGTPKVDTKLTSQLPSQHESPSDGADVQEKTEEKLLKLLSDFNSGKIKAFSEEERHDGLNMMSHMEDIRDQQEGLGKLHFELSGAGIGVVLDGRKQPAPLSKERLSIANDNMNRLMTHLEKLSFAIESLSPATMPTLSDSNEN